MSFNHEEPRDDSFSFEWTNGEEELTPETQKLLDELSVPVGRVPTRRIAETVHKDLINRSRDRLDALRVEGWDEVAESWIKATPEIQMDDFILDDVHYEIYKARKNRGPYNRFISVTAREIFQHLADMRERGESIVTLQRDQDYKATEDLIRKGQIEDGSVYSAMATPEGRFAVRSLHRLLLEDCMKGFRSLMAKATRRRMDEAPLTFAEVAGRAPHFLDMKIRQYNNFDARRLSTNQKILHELVGQELARARAFAGPVTDYLARQLPSG